jgi:hypothetical protein
MPGHDSIPDAVEYTHACFQQIFHVSPGISASEVARDFLALSKATRPITRGERGVLSIFKPKTAALLGNRVWLQYPGENPDLDFGFGWQSPMAVRLAALMAFANSSGLIKPDESSSAPSEDRFIEFLAITHREMAEEYARLTGAAVTPLYRSIEARDREYSSGDCTVIVSIVEQVAIVREDMLTWEQVIEFRRDAQARSAYRRFVHWLDRDMLNRPENYVLDEVNRRIEDYSWALRKHGLQVIIGALERTVDVKGLIGSATAALTVESLMRLPLVALFAGVGVAVGNAALHLATALIERKDLVQNTEIAFVHQLRDRFGSNTAG